MELGVFDNVPSGSASSSENNLNSIELASDIGMKLDSLQRKLSLDFLNSNRRLVLIMYTYNWFFTF